MSSHATEQVLSAVLESESIDTIESIKMDFSADFSSGRACSLLAQLIDSAPMLKEISISRQCGERKVRVELKSDKTKVGGEPGLIKVIEWTLKEYDES